MQQIKNALLDVKNSLEQTLQIIDLTIQGDADLQIMFGETRGAVISTIRKLNGKLLIVEDEEKPVQPAAPLTKMFGKDIVVVPQEERPVGEII